MRRRPRDTVGYIGLPPGGLCMPAHLSSHMNRGYQVRRIQRYPNAQRSKGPALTAL